MDDGTIMIVAGNMAGKGGRRYDMHGYHFPSHISVVSSRVDGIGVLQSSYW